ncbi:hypothetical protein KFK09_004777 [Dendrobium nobile]|uniref:Reverse transcriptase domain-containing protein n=1 Tax=Dendrobium nobile TaxID=94219 RepID=A0A8T3BXA7_DENNO|nr:hypothetical protein KFK09_004777 [Dendrobium nobile]
MNVIHKLVSEEQVAFIKGRSLSEHVLIAQELFHKFRFSNSKGGLMAIKLDMKQAYDSMAWNTLKQVLNYFGFPIGYSKLVMECVTDPIFIVHINGVGLDGIKGRSGFRQGCPLSPYLFILCSQLLTNAPTAPRISHLLFADDILVFSMAKRENLLKIRKITFDYYKWTGQQVNFSKSAIIFSKKMERRRRMEFSKLMGFMEVKELNYLGIKIALRRLVVTNFSVILEKAIAKLDIWGNKLISMPCRVVLIKTVVLALHIFYSSLSLVPMSILNKLDRLCRDFLWYKKNGNSGILYVAWKDVCIPENQGGLGILSATDSVEPLRAKLAWNFLKKPHSLLYKSLSIKYGRSVWDVERRPNSSPSWKLILSGAKMLRHIVKWNIKDGTSINIMKDVWIMVEALTEGEWIPDKLKCFFGDELVNVICNTKIHMGNNEDDLQLLKNYSGKTISAMVRDGNSYLEEENHSFVQHWKNIKKLNLIPRIAFFWCRLLKNAIPSCEFLMHRRLLDNNLCLRDYGMKEDGEHVAAAFSSNNPYTDHWGANQLYKLNSSFWHPPPPGWIKVNIDASLLPSNEAGIGGIFRDNKGRMLLSFGFSVVHWDIVFLDLLAFCSLREVIKDWMMDARGLIIETDNSNVISYLQKSFAKDN